MPRSEKNLKGQLAALAEKGAVASRMLDWYDRHRRDLPWRAPPGKVATPYHVWLSEIMLQQTTVQTVKPYFEKFIRLWPNVHALAEAGEESVLREWAGLGYYSRARNLVKAAWVLKQEYNGVFPESEKALKSLPGIGEYTSAAIMSIAFDRPATVVDGNIERVMVRLNAVDQPVEKAKQKIKALAANFTPENRAGDYAQSLMDLGATICTPTAPKCVQCPLSDICLAKEKGIQEKLPKRLPKKVKPVRTGDVYWIEKEDQVYLIRRPGKGLLGGMPIFPTTGWIDDNTPFSLPNNTHKMQEYGEVRHTFTHFHLKLKVRLLDGVPSNLKKGEWVPVRDVLGFGLPTVMKKVARLVLADR